MSDDGVAEATIRVVVLDPSKADRTRILTTLRRWSAPHFEVIGCAHLDDALTRLEKESFDAVVMDMSTDDDSGLIDLAAIRAHAMDVAVVVVSSGPPDAGREAMRLGAQDFLVKDEPRLMALPRFVEWAVQRQRNVANLLDVAMRDELTGVLNRRGFFALAEHLLALRLRKGLSVTVLVMDLDGFKAVNDREGHVRGDEVLRTVARVLSSCCRDSDLFARLGGDEFVMMLIDDARSDPTGRLRERFARSVAEGLLPEDLGLSIGMTRVGSDGRADMHAMLVAADAAMYVDKRSKRASQTP